MIEFWFEFGSTYSYPAAMRVAAAAEQAGVALRWRPFLLGPIFGAQGWQDSPFNIYEAKGAYMWRDLERTCRDLALPWKRPSEFPRNGLLAARVACQHQEEAWMPAFVRAVYRANFVDDREISAPEVVRDCLSGLSVDADDVLAAAEAPESKAALRGQTEVAIERGIFGAPMFSVDRELFWGNDRLEAALDWAVKGAA